MNATRPHIQLLWFQDCPNHEAAEALLHEVMYAYGVDAPVERVEVPDEQVGISVCFPGSPTIRIDGRDVEPDWTPAGPPPGLSESPLPAGGGNLILPPLGHHA